MPPAPSRPHATRVPESTRSEDRPWGQVGAEWPSLDGVRFIRPGTRAVIAWYSTGRRSPLLVLPGHVSGLAADIVPSDSDTLFGNLSTRFGLLRFDRPGMGLSRAATPAFGLAAQVGQITAVLDAAEVDRTSIFGWGIGAQVAIAFAATHPQRVHRLVLCNAAARFFSAGAEDGVLTTGAMAALADLARRAWPLASAAISRALLPEADRATIDWFDRYQLHAMSGSVAAEMLDAMAAFDVSPMLRHIKAPTLLIQRRQALVVSPDRTAELAEGIADARVELIEGSAHLPEVGNWKLVAALIRVFVEPAEVLTVREHAVLAGVQLGHRNAQIARTLGITESTVARHLANVYTKLDVSTRSGAVHRARRLRLLSDE